MFLLYFILYTEPCGKSVDSDDILTIFKNFFIIYIYIYKERFGVEIKFNGMGLDVIQKIRERAEIIADTEYDVE